ncbi:MAG: hypothetical protein AB1327_08045 [Bacillota bacterium]
MSRGLSAVSLLREALVKLDQEHREAVAALEKEYKAKRAEMEQALRVLKKVAGVCENCDGRGTVRIPTAAGDCDTEQCAECGGKGVVADALAR